MESGTGQIMSRSANLQPVSRTCPACGATARRVEAGFCSTCGRTLDENYLPADTLRASYHLQQRRSQDRQPAAEQTKRPMPSMLAAQNRNGASMTALAFVTYSLVPYLGILFCPGAVLMGGVGLLQSLRAPQRGGRRASYMSITLGLLILCVQLVLWWILYKVPEWAGAL